MLQEILVVLIIGGALIWAGVRISRNFVNRDTDPCDGCGSSCGSCAVNDLKKEIEQKQLEKMKKNDVLNQHLKN